MSLLTRPEIDRFLAEEPLWCLISGQLEREWEFPDFVSAMHFVNHAAELAEAANHHPDIDIRYNRVRLALISHDAGGLTKRDLSMARRFGP